VADLAFLTIERLRGHKADDCGHSASMTIKVIMEVAAMASSQTGR
jgi:hypothetical protein